MCGEKATFRCKSEEGVLERDKVESLLFFRVYEQRGAGHRRVWV